MDHLSKCVIGTRRIVGMLRRKWQLYCGMTTPLKRKKNPGTRQTFVPIELPPSKFSEETINCLPTLPWIITDEDLACRVDLRDICICSVDPPGCTDIDDALHCRLLSNGNLEIGVHIADVSHFIHPGSALDTEAAERGNTVYLVDKRIDMVPELLSSNLCSLRGNEVRLAFSCIWEVDDEANILSTQFHKTIIESKKAMTYEEAQLIIDDVSQQHDIARNLRILNKFAKLLKRRRISNGALLLASLESRYEIDNETHDPIEVEAEKTHDTNSMVEEFMLLANVSVAEKIEKEFPECAMLRRHAEPSQIQLEPLVKAGQNQGFHIDTSTVQKLAISLNAAVKADNPYFNTMMRILAARCMPRALYFVSGTMKKSEYYHYGLAAPIYTHFTSPIRRYADIIVHRLLAACVAADSTYPEFLDKYTYSELCDNLNYRYQMAQLAGRASEALFFKGHKQEEEGYVLLVRRNALRVLIPKFGLEGTVYVSGINRCKNTKLTSEFVYNKERRMHFDLFGHHQLLHVTHVIADDNRIGRNASFAKSNKEQTQRCGNFVFRSFDPVTVRLKSDTSNVQPQKLILELVKPYIEGFSVRSIKQEEQIDDQSNTEAKQESETNGNGGKYIVKSKEKDEIKC